ncbi:MAG: SGNH/GDSL hydrolase family protein [Paludibacter sp.]
MRTAICIFLLSIVFASTEAQENLFFSAGDRVCFVGNSITNNGEFHHNILLYHTTRFPNQELEFFNCGISGDNTQGIINRMESDILIHKPNKVLIMIGMNDINRGLYGTKPTINADTLRLRKEALSRYKTNLDKIITLLLSKKITVILQKPSIYDETAVLSTPTKIGANDALKNCAEIMEEFSVKYKLQTVDYWTPMTKMNQEIQIKDPKATLVGSDRIHPGAIGHIVMAYHFLKAEKAPAFVSHIVIDKNKKQQTSASKNCEINSIQWESNKITFKVKEAALPFPVISEQKEATELVPFTNELNTELLKVKGLSKGDYKLTIDSVLIGQFTAAQFSEGLNLANYPSTPQYKQAMRVRDILWELRTVVSKYRGLKFIEFNGDFRKCPDKTNLQVVQNYMDSVFSTGSYKTNPYFKSRLKDYVQNKPKENEFVEMANNLRKKSYVEAQTKYHNYIIEP